MKYQANSSYILFGLYATLLFNSLLLYILNFNWLPGAYRGTLVFHIVAGLAIVLPLTGFLVAHIKSMPHRANLRAVTASVLSVVSIAGTIATGLLLYDEDLAAYKKMILWLHFASVIVFVAGIFTHIALRRRNNFHFYVPLSAANIKRRGYPKHPFIRTLILSNIIFALFVLVLAPISQKGSDIVTKEFEPAAAQIKNHRYLPSEALDGSKSCGDKSCHPDIYEQWNESMHHFSSFNNPYYKKAIEALLADNPVDKVRWCASCHDQLLLLPGDVKGDGFALINNHPNREKGITCLVCHAIDGSKDITGNGNYLIHDPGYDAMGATLFGKSPGLRKAVILTKPEPHAISLLSDHLRTEKFCASCHKVSVPPAVNDYRWKRGQDNYDEWYASSFSGKHARAFYDRETKNCLTCHMPSVPSQDKGNDDGFVKSHRFAVANTAMPFITGHPKQLATAQEFLKNDIAAVDIFEVQVNGKKMDPESALPVLSPGDEVAMDIMVSNKNVGHSLPSGTNDSNEWWLEVQLQGNSGKAVLSSGALTESKEVDSTAHFFKVILIDENAGTVNKRNVQNWYATALNSAIPSGWTHIVRYQFTVPKGEKILQIKAALQQRKFNAYFNQFAFAGELPAGKTINNAKGKLINQWIFNDTRPPEIPITTVAQDVRKTGIPHKPNTPLWKRWNNYGIGLLAEENYRKAQAAFQQVAKLEPTKADGLVNQGRVLLAEGSILQAKEILKKALTISPENQKAKYFLGQAYFSEGLYDKTLPLWEAIVAAYPEDPVLLSDLGQLHYLMGNYEKAEQYFQKSLVINPEDYQVIYRLMLVYGAMNKPDLVKEWQAKYKYYKPNEEENEAIAKFRKEHIIENREAQKLHYHALH